MNIILLGPPGAGKGTQAKKIASEYKVPHISTGDIFREASGSGSELGKELQGYMSAGKLVPDELVIKIVKERLLRPDCLNGFLLDGFPRTLVQAQSLDAELSKVNRKIDMVVSLTVDSEEVVKRLSSRRVCVACGFAYNLSSNMPKNAAVCDACGGKVIQRADDNEDTIRKRLTVYKNQTEPLIKYYTDKRVIAEINGMQSPDEVFKNITSVLVKK